MDLRVKPLFDKYANFITNNAETTGDIEMLCKYLSYFVSGLEHFLIFINVFGSSLKIIIPIFGLFDRKTN